MLCVHITPEQWAVIATAVAGLLAAWAAIRRSPADIAKVRAEADQNAAQALSRLFTDFNTLSEQLKRSEAKETEARATLQELRIECDRYAKELRAAAERIVVLRSAMPMVTVGEKLSRMTTSTRDVLNACRDGVVVTSQSNRGQFVFVNTAFAQALGMSAEDLLVTNWRELLHPADVESTLNAESNAWSEGGIVTNRYRHKDGHYVKMQWHFTNYSEGGSLSIVWFDRRRDSDITHTRRK